MFAPESPPSSELATRSPSMLKAIDTLLLAARSEAPIMLTAGMGTDVGALARLAHDNSPRRDRPFLSLSCPSIDDVPPTVFRLGGGTLFLEGVGDLRISFQMKLLHVLEKLHSKATSSTRLISATTRDLDEDISRGRFREDLFFRLSVVDIRIPPLRERPEDILPLARDLMVSLSAGLGRRVPTLSKDAAVLLAEHDWPANFRELRNIIERVLLTWPGDVIGPEAFTDIIQAGVRRPHRSGSR